MKTFIFNMGYDISHVSSVLAKEELDDGSCVILLVPGEPDERQSNAIRDIENQLDSLDIDIELETFTAGNSVVEDIGPIMSLLERVDNPVVSLSGGSRDILVPLTVALIIVDRDVKEIYFRSDVSSELEKLSLPKMGVDIDERGRQILKSAGSGLTVKELAEETDLSKSTVYRRIEELESKGLIEVRDESPEEIVISGLGKAIIKN
jgi:CRISPR-associated protein Csa3